MVTIVVDKTKLVNILKANLVKHEAAFHAAVDIYREKVVAELSKLSSEMEETKHPESVDLHIDLPKPVSYGDEYRAVLSMFELSNDLCISVSSDDHKKWVLDKWTWTDHFNMNTTNYSRHQV